MHAGTIPRQLGELRELTVLSLKGNQLEGEPGSSDAVYPGKMIYSADSYIRCHLPLPTSLHSCSVSLKVPTCVGQGASTTYDTISVHRSCFEFGRQLNNRVIHLSASLVKLLLTAGDIPMELGNLSKLKMLFLSSNKLSGEDRLLVSRIAKEARGQRVYPAQCTCRLLRSGRASHLLHSRGVVPEFALLSTVDAVVLAKYTPSQP